jgi:hypothetical protein
MTAVARTSSVVGGVLWSLVAFYVTLVILSGFGRWDAPNAYVTAIFVLGALAINGLLFRRAKTDRTPSTLALLVVSLSLSVTVIGTFFYVALG